MKIDLSNHQPDEYGTYKLPYQSSLLEREVVLIIPSDHGKVQSWQLDVAQKFTQKELLLKEEVFQKIFDYYQQQVSDLRVQFGDSADKMAPEIDNAEQIKKIITPTGIYIGELDASEEAVGLLFECSWEPEHGLGVFIKNWNVEEVGCQDLAFTI